MTSPRDYFTDAYIARRFETPETLFHFTHPDNALEILGSGILLYRFVFSLEELRSLTASVRRLFGP